MQLLCSRLGRLVAVDAAARLRKKPASMRTAANVRLLCRKKAKPRGSAGFRGRVHPRHRLIEGTG